MNQVAQLNKKDLFFASINGFVFGLLLPVVMRSFNVTTQPPYLITVLFFTILAPLGIYFGYLLAKFIKPFFFQLTKFGATGAANFAIDIGILALFVFIFFPSNIIIPSIYYATFKVISFVLATINSYIWNKYWTFQEKNTSTTLKEFGKFILVSSIGLILNASIATLLNSLHHLISLDIKTWAAISAMIASVAVLTWNFIGYKFLVFKK